MKKGVKIRREKAVGQQEADSAVGLELADSSFQDNKGLRSSSLRNSHLSGLHTQNPPDSENLQNGLAKLVLVIVKLLLEVIERQAYRRVADGTLDEEQIERLGDALMQVRQKFEEMSRQFGFQPEELDVNLGNAASAEHGLRHATSANSLSSGNALGLTTSSLVEIVDRLIEKGTTIAGKINVSVAGIDLIVLDLLATLQPVRNMLENNDTKRRKSSSRRRRRGSKDGRKNKREKRT
jgi:gas vesicle protein GvpK/gas vesicle protein GvpA/GvpJ/GvpM family